MKTTIRAMEAALDGFKVEFLTRLEAAALRDRVEASRDAYRLAAATARRRRVLDAMIGYVDTPPFGEEIARDIENLASPLTKPGYTSPVLDAVPTAKVIHTATVNPSEKLELLAQALARAGGVLGQPWSSLPPSIRDSWRAMAARLRGNRDHVIALLEEG